MVFGIDPLSSPQGVSPQSSVSRTSSEIDFGKLLGDALTDKEVILGDQLSQVASLDTVSAVKAPEAPVVPVDTDLKETIVRFSSLANAALKAALPSA